MCSRDQRPWRVERKLDLIICCHCRSQLTPGDFLNDDAASCDHCRIYVCSSCFETLDQYAGDPSCPSNCGRNLVLDSERPDEPDSPITLTPEMKAAFERIASFITEQAKDGDYTSYHHAADDMNLEPEDIIICQRIVESGW